MSVAGAAFKNNDYQNLAKQIVDDLSDAKLEDQLDGFLELVGLSNEKLKQRAIIGESLLALITTIFEDCSIYPIGPDFLNIATDLDPMILVVDAFAKMSKDFIFSDKGCQLEVSKEMFKLLKKEQYNLKFCKELQTIESEGGDQIDKITFVHRDSGIKCIIVVENYIIVQDSRLIKYIKSLDSRLPYILSFINVFGSVYNLLQTQDEIFPNHSLIWMLLAFLSNKMVVPTINELHQLNKSSLILDNVDIGFSDDKSLLTSLTQPPMMDDPAIRAFSVTALIKEFFEFFAKADLKRYVVSPAVGKMLPVSCFKKNIKKFFPEEIKQRYLFDTNGASRNQTFYSGSPMGKYIYLLNCLYCFSK
jgi:hypothetical protein